MTFLAPLYIAGIAAVTLPILFHLIRRTPQGRQPFSSLMFLQPSPPRLTKRSRLSNLLLLILRGLAVALLALAFARPLFQNRAEAEPGAGKSKRVVILVDTSASMRRGDLWAQAKAQVEAALKDVTPAADQVGLFFFDRGVRPALTFAEWNDLEPSNRVAVLKDRLSQASPTWFGTSLGEALATTADLLAEAEGSRGGATPSGGRQLVLVSDLQQGSHAESLQGHQWPEHVTLKVLPVAPKDGKTTNAVVQVVRETIVDPTDDGSRLRVRVSSQTGATAEQFTLRWADAKGPLAGVEPVPAYVPSGRSQVVRVSWPSVDRSADRLILSGDDADFDDTLYVVRPRKEDVRVVYAGDDKPDDPSGLQFYLRSAAADTVGRHVDLVAKRSDEPLAEPDLLGTRLLVVAGSQSIAARLSLVQRFAEAGGDALLVLTDAGAAAVETLAKVTGTTDGLDVQEASVRDHALIGRVDVRHPLFAPFADARLGDFTKIHFWKHRRVTLPAGGAARVLAAFDGGDPFLIDQPVGKGRVFVMTSGWHPADGQLALSTKFVPLIEGFLRRRDGAVTGGLYAVGDSIPLPIVASTGTTTTAPSRTLTDPDGKPVPLAADATAFAGADRPGVYKLTVNGEEQLIAVNLSPDESRTAPLAVEDFERWGAKVGTTVLPEDVVTRQRQLQRAELENRQKMWQWLIAAVLVLLAAETVVAGRLAHRTTVEPAAE